MHFTIDNHVLSYLVGRIKYNLVVRRRINQLPNIRTYTHLIVFYFLNTTLGIQCASSSSSASSPPSSYSQFYVGSMYDNIHLHVAWSYTSSADSPFSLMSSFTLSNHLLLGLPLFLLSCTFITIALLPTQCSSLLITCPYHFNLIYSVLHHRYNKYMHTLIIIVAISTI